MRSLFRRGPRRPAPTSPVPPLGDEPLAGDGRRARGGVHLHRLGGAPIWTAAGSWPRAADTLAVRGYTLGRRSLPHLEVLLDDRPWVVAPLVPGDPQADGRRKQVFNQWLDLAGVAPGPHRVTVRPPGLLGRLLARSRRVVVVSADELPGSDAALPAGLGPDLDRAVAALPSVVRPARRGVLPDPVRSVLLVRADQLGDLAISVPAVQRLRALFPDARFTALLTADNAEFGRASGLFDMVEVAAFPEAPALGRRAMAAAEQRRLADCLRPARFDLGLDLGEGAQSRHLLHLAGARFTAGFRHGDHGWLSAAFEFNGRDPADGLEVIPPARKLVALADAVGALRPPPAGPVLPLAPDPALLARHGLAPGERFLLLHGGARLAPSRWPHLAALVALLLARTGLAILLFDPDGTVAVPADPRVRRLPLPLPFAEFDALLAAAAVMVGNDSGPKHLAAVRGTPVVSLHLARLNWNEWGQEGDGLILSRRVPCAGCGIGAHLDECGRGYQCLTGITAEEACAAVLALLAGQRQPLSR